MLHRRPRPQDGRAPPPPPPSSPRAAALTDSFGVSVWTAFKSDTRRLLRLSIAGDAGASYSWLRPRAARVASFVRAVEKRGLCLAPEPLREVAANGDADGHLIETLGKKPRLGSGRITTKHNSDGAIASSSSSSSLVTLHQPNGCSSYAAKHQPNGCSSSSSLGHDAARIVIERRQQQQQLGIIPAAAAAAQLLSPPSVLRTPDDPSVPAFDKNRTELLRPMDPTSAMKLIEALPSTDPMHPAARKRWRARQIVNDLTSYLLQGLGMRVQFVVQGEQPSPAERHDLLGPKLLVLKISDEGKGLRVMHLVAPFGEYIKEVLTQRLEDLVKWMILHLPEMVRKGKIHEGMAGHFFSLGAHLSQHLGASIEVELKRGCRCACTKPDCDYECDTPEIIAKATEISREFQSMLAATMPVEHATQTALRERFFTHYAKHAETVEKLMLGDQHGMCCSIANKVAVLHDDQSNHGAYNGLAFGGSEYIKQQYAKDPNIDLGYWVQEDTKIKLYPGLFIIFDSSSDHACIPAEELLPFATNQSELAPRGMSYMHKMKARAMEAILLDRTLAEGFKSLEDAALYNSSLFGVTTFVQRAVTNQMRAAMANECVDSLLRVPQPRKTKVKGAELLPNQEEEEEIEAPSLPPAFSTRSAMREQLMAEEMEKQEAVLNGLEALCVICGDGEEGGQKTMPLCKCRDKHGFAHGAHICCMFTEGDRQHARRCVHVAEAPFTCPWHMPASEDATHAYCSLNESVGSTPLLKSWERGSKPLRELTASAAGALQLCQERAGATVYVRQDGGHLRRGVIATTPAPEKEQSRYVKASVEWADGGGATSMYVYGGRVEVRVQS